MKKIFTLFVALFAMTFFANAQYLLQEGFDDATVPSTWTAIDADGDSHNWGEAASLYSGYQGHNGLGISSASYINDVGALTPDNWLITPAINLTNDATLTFWIAAQDASYANEHYGVYVSTTGTSTSNFTLIYEEDMDANGGARDQGTWKQKTVSLSAYTGQTIYIAFRHFNCTDAFWLNIDDVEVFSNPTTPTIVCPTSSIDFGGVVMGNTAEDQVTVTAYNLTAGITATTAAPFAVSATGSNFGTTATIPQNGGTLYVQYDPTTAGAHNGIVTLSSTGANNVSITLTGNAIDCGNTPLPYSTDFSDENLNQCWTIDDYNGDENTWEFNTEGGYAVYPYNAEEAADDWLISPVFHIGANAAASFDYMCANASFPERFEVYVIGAGQTYDNATLVVPAVDVTVTSWTTQDINLSAFANQHIQIAIRCTSDADEYLLGVTNFFIDSDPVSVANVEKTSVNVYPNPASNYINVNASSNISNVEIYTISGQKVGDFTANGTQTVISTSNLSNGMYLMRINTENGVINNKFSVVR